MGTWRLVPFIQDSCVQECPNSYFVHFFHGLQINGDVDMSFFAPDCFHMSVKGHRALAAGLWSNMVSPSWSTCQLCLLLFSLNLRPLISSPFSPGHKTQWKSNRVEPIWLYTEVPRCSKHKNLKYFYWQTLLLVFYSSLVPDAPSSPHSGWGIWAQDYKRTSLLSDTLQIFLIQTLI